METLYLIIIIIIVIILFWLIFGQSSRSRCLNQLNGLWMADDDFCKESGIDLMTIYFGDCPSTVETEKKSGVNKLCWFLIINNKGESNHITVANLSKCAHIKGEQYKFDIELQDVPDNLFSTNLSIKIVPGELITIIDPDTDIKVFEGTKNKEASDLIDFKLD